MERATQLASLDSFRKCWVTGEVTFEVTNLVSGVSKRRSDGVREGRVRILEELCEGRPDALRSERDEDAEFSEQTSDGIDACGTRRDPCRPESVQSSERLLVDALDRDGSDVLVARSFKERFGISAIGLVASDVWPDAMWWQEDDIVTDGAQGSRRVVR